MTVPFATVLLELRRITATCLSSCVHNVHEEDHDVTVTRKTPKKTVRRTSCRSRRTIPSGGASAVTPRAGAVDAGAGQDDPRGGRASGWFCNEYLLFIVFHVRFPLDCRDAFVGYSHPIVGNHQVLARGRDQAKS